uniref:NADH-ubiquinone oxidoreductase chain 4 n=1 Tax=Paragyrodactylus variegatus TaxID=1415179 RepID=A0A076VF60_9PLAT|nr:NADH dehydrogenase subunit 4 [Paragyrodactylus variegatus]AIK25761.1 NADH dehydrogenase subunit 4 [Paragyrodactylus variegatus]
MILWQIFPLSIVFIIFILISPLMISNGIYLNNFTFDNLSAFIGILPLFIFFSLYSLINLSLSKINVILVFLSCFSSFLCFFCCSYILFFILYELSIVLLLFSLFTGSPYSERSIAGWYFLGYLVFGGLPLLMLCLYSSYFNFSCIVTDYITNFNFISNLFFVIFITKVPLFPFHSWLPIVHAEANSFVSIMLSGYIMKLGLIGIHRFFLISGDFLKVYFLVFFFCSCFFFLNSFLELDNKRWLAFLSLGHISLGMLSIFSLDYIYSPIVGIFSFGHGLSVCIMFYYFYLCSEFVGSRNWIMILLHNNTGFNILLCFGLLSLIAFPPCILFFCEVYVYLSLLNIISFIYVYSLYIFLSIFGPVTILGLMFSRKSQALTTSMVNSSIYYLFSLIFIFFLLGLFI